MSKYNITLKFGTDKMILPVNPEEITVKYPGDNETKSVVGFGEILIPRPHLLREVVIESFFPERTSRIYNALLVHAFATELRGRITIEDLLPPLDMWIAISDYEHTNKSGEENDLYYILSLKEYPAYGARVVEIVKETAEITEVLPEEPPRVDEQPPVPRTYTVVWGDTLWGIAQRYTGNGMNWNELYELNKGLLGRFIVDRPERLFPGDVLTLPDSWVTE